MRGKPADAIKQLEDARERYRAAANKVGEGLALADLGSANLQLERFEASRANLEEAQKLAAGLGNRELEIKVLDGLGLDLSAF
jgi:hypothetical protein